MTTGRINQVAAFLAHPRLQQVQGSGAPAVRTVHTPPKRAQELVSTDQVSIGHAERPTRQAVAQSTHAQLGRLPFFESSLRVLSARSSASETARLGCRNTDPGGTPAGAAVPPAGRCRSRSHQGPELTPTVLATGSVIRLHIVY